MFVLLMMPHVGPMIRQYKCILFYSIVKVFINYLYIFPFDLIKEYFQYRLMTDLYSDTGSYWSV